LEIVDLGSPELRDKLKRFLEERIEHLKRELEMYEALLYLLDAAALEEEPAEEHQVKTPQGEEVAVVKIGRNSVRIVMLREIPVSSPLVRSFLLRVIDEQLMKLNPRSPPKVRVKSRDGSLSEIVIESRLPEHVVEQIEAALKFMAMKLGS